MQPGSMQPGGMGGQSPFANANSAADKTVQEFYDKLMADEVDSMSDLFSSKATGKAKVFRDGKATEETVSELKGLLSSMRLASSKSLRGMHIVLMEENSGNDASQPATGRGRPKRKLTKKVQFTVVTENGKSVISGLETRDH